VTTSHPGSVLEKFLPDALAFLERLVGVNSFTGNPAGVDANAALIAAQFAPLGFEAESVLDPNPAFGRHLFLRRHGLGGQGILLVTHLDTVFPAEEEARENFRWSVEGDRIFGPGVNDNKGGTAMIWLVLATLREMDPQLFENTHWVIAADAAEEELTSQFPRFCQERLPANCRAALVFEACTGQGRGLTLVRCRKGSANFRVSTEGRGAHAGSRHHEGANAVVELAHIIQRIAALTDYSRDLTANVGRIEGGGPSNRVPHAASCEVNIRAFDEAILQEAVDAMFAMENEPAFVRAHSDGHACRVKVELTSRNPAWPQNPSTDGLIALWEDAASRLGIPLLVEPRGGLSDGNYLSKFAPVLDGVGPFGLNGHASERSPDGSKMPESVLPASFLSMGAINVAAIQSLLR
jgi:glutamate carboxypeptidase